MCMCVLVGVHETGTHSEKLQKLHRELLTTGGIFEHHLTDLSQSVVQY